MMRTLFISSSIGVLGVVGGVSLFTPSLAAVGDATTVGSLSFVPTFRSIGVYSSFSGDLNANNVVSLEWRKKGEAAWKSAHAPFIDRADSQARGSIVMLSPNTAYEVRITYTDGDGVLGTNPVIGAVTTKNDQFSLGSGTAYYVSTTGNDLNPGTEAQPFRTIQKALNMVAAGGTVYIKAGTYTESLSLGTSGTASNYITITNFANEKVIIDGNQGAILNLFTLTNADYVRISGLEFRNALGSLLLLKGADDVVIENNILTEPGYKITFLKEKGIEFEGAVHLRESSKNTVVRNNTFTRNTPMTTKVDIKGIIHWRAGEGSIIYNNMFRGGFEDGFGGGPEDTTATPTTIDMDIYDNVIDGACYDDGIQAEGPGMNVRIWGNTISGCYISMAFAPVLKGPTYVFRNVVYDNAHVNRGGSGLYKMGDEGTSGTKYFYHNTFYANTAPQTSDGYKQTNNPSPKNIVSRNNIVRASRYVLEHGSCSSSDYDYDALYTTDNTGRFIECTGTSRYSSTSSFCSGAGMECNGFTYDALPDFVDAANKDFRLKSTSQLVDRGVLIPGFNGPDSAWPSFGAAPDIGAFEVVGALETTPPVRSNGSPSGTLPAGTTSTTISLITDETATCKYTVVSGIDYALMIGNFSTTGATSHSTTISGLTNGRTYNYYVKCQDAAGNANPDDFVISFSVATSGPPPFQGLVGYWDFNEGSGSIASDSSGQGNKGTLTNMDAATAWVPGQVDTALDFDGIDDVVTVLHSPSLDITGNQLTIALWMKPAAFGQPSGSYVATKSDGGTASIYGIKFKSSGVVEAAVRTGGSETEVQSNSTLSLGTWYHVAEVYDGSTIKIYINGVQDTSVRKIGNLDSLATSFSIGAHANNPSNRRFQGTVDEVRVYSRALSAGEVAVLARAPDLTPPVRSNGSPTGTLPAGTTSTTLSLTTNEAATCKYDTFLGTAYGSMASAFSTTGGTLHSTLVSGLLDGASYTYYVRCRDAAGNANASDFPLRFSIDAASFSLTTLNQYHLFLEEENAFEVRGSNFAITESFKLKFLQAGVPRKEILVNPINATTLRATITSVLLAGLPPGLYDIVVERVVSGETKTYATQVAITRKGDLWSASATASSLQKRDGKIDIFDVSRMLSKWGSTQAAELAEADINPGPANVSQGKIDLYDANLMMRNWTGS